MITYKKGDIFEDGWDIIINTVNCVGVMGKGLALEFKKRYPKMFLEYKEACNRNEYTPGCLKHYLTNEYDIILNAATKDHWKSPSQYKWIINILNELKLYLKDHERKTVHVPMLGCGNGGLHKSEVKILIDKILKNVDCNIIVYE